MPFALTVGKQHSLKLRPLWPGGCDWADDREEPSVETDVKRALASSKPLLYVYAPHVSTISGWRSKYPEQDLVPRVT
ncbi:hypothetical protein DLJ60_29745 [Micromonospora chalcea]|uniref:Uncharacterized protein n=1 Tax=Micromonospora chalcea TaxID=1874 RepID=A0ABX9XUZ3_MICCH|nr:hypothetical protein A8711_23630 [Micromonospora sp. II]RQW85764.1 hypothetical protein DLJ60_29745 [Micromonospora chalcea]RQX53927.1 hypothetical protein DLJ57_08655 [Micromonospora chalcea]